MRFRPVPAAVSLSPEWVRASALARTIHRAVRPNGGELVLPAVGEGEAPWSQFQRFAAERGAHYSPAEAEQVVEDCCAAGLWSVRNGALVVGAFPPSFEAERVNRTLGPRGGLSPAEKMRNLRERKRAEREALEGQAPAEGVTGNRDVTAVTGDVSSSLETPKGVSEREKGPSGHAPVTAGEVSAAAPPAAPARLPLESLPLRDRGAELLRLLGAGLGPRASLLGATGAELEGFARLFGPRAEGAAARVERVNRWLAQVSADALRAAVPYTQAARRGAAVVVTPELLLGAALPKGEKGYKGTGWRSLEAAASAWETEQRDAAAARAARPGPATAGPSLAALPVPAGIAGRR